MNTLELGFAFLFAQTATSLVNICWYTVAFEIPRYMLAFVAASLAMRTPVVEKASRRGLAAKELGVSVILVGHNEQDSLESCVRSLRQQTFRDFEIVIVSDGSTDKMRQVARELVRRGLATRVLSTDLRGGKPSGINLGVAFASGGIIVNVDCDCQFDRHAIERLLEPFDDPGVGAVCGDIVPRNGDRNLFARFQEIEYLQSISVGKRVQSAIGQVVCASGAFSAFRRNALKDIRGFDPGGGEDLDTTIRLRRKGWRIEYAPEAICYTDVPATMYSYVKQRLRWERDAFWIRFRKHKWLWNPTHCRFRLSEAIHQWDYILFNIVSAVVFPVYLIWLVASYGAFALSALIAAQAALLCMDTFMLAISTWCTRRRVFFRNLLFLPGYSLFMTYVMRPVRLIACIDEAIFSGSRRDNYTPAKVRRQRPW